MIEERVTEFEVSLLPQDYPEGYLWAVKVAYRGRNLWGIYWGMQCLGLDGQWDWEASPSNRADEWLAAHRFRLDEALVLARAAAVRVGVSSHRDQRFMTAQDVLDRDEREGNDQAQAQQGD